MQSRIHQIIENKNTGGKSEKNSRDKNPDMAVKLTNRIWIIIFTSFGATFETTGAILLNIHPQPLAIGLIFIFAGLIFGALILRLTLINHKMAHPIPPSLPNFSCAGLITIAFSGCLLAYRVHIPDRPLPEPPKLHFTFALEYRNAPWPTTNLTNDFLSITNRTRHTFDSPTAGLVLPSIGRQANLLAQILVSNDSPVTAENMEVKVSIPEKIGAMFSPEWQLGDTMDGPDLFTSRSPSGEVTTNIMACRIYHDLFGAHPSNILALPPVSLPTSQSSVSDTLTISVQAKDSPVNMIQFTLFAPPPSLSPIEPFVALFDTNGRILKGGPPVKD